NAVKFTPAGEVSVRVRQVERHDDSVRIAVEVSDTGIGIAPQDQARVFSDFSQASASTTRTYGGTGLGLGICRRLVAMMGGQLRLDSALGRGSRFHFELELPVAEASMSMPLETGPAPALPVGERALAGLRLLVVEDNPVNQQVARELLVSQGAEVTLANDGQEGVHRVQTADPPYDAVLMDMQMPVMDGLTATREIRSHERFKHLCIVAMTANAMQQDREQCLAAGMNEHIAKPIEEDELWKTLARCLDRPTPQLRQPVRMMSDLPAGLPELAALDAAAGLRRVRGDVVAYRQLLRRFVPSQGGMPARLRLALAGGDIDTARREAHTLRGVAATLGAMSLAQQAGKLEHLLRDDAKEIQVEGMLSSMEVSLAQLVAAIEAMPPEPVASGSGVASGGPAVPALLGQLRTLLQAGDVEALAVFEASADTLRAASGPDFEALASAIRTFDFETASQQVAAWMSRPTPVAGEEGSHE
ncbi:MAG: response regulator, partial [Comamonadaceae bacterium]